jgi:hypothetical protein
LQEALWIFKKTEELEYTQLIFEIQAIIGKQKSSKRRIETG